MGGHSDAKTILSLNMHIEKLIKFYLLNKTNTKQLYNRYLQYCQTYMTQRHFKPKTTFNLHDKKEYHYDLKQTYI